MPNTQMDELRDMMQTLVGARLPSSNYCNNICNHRNHNSQGSNTLMARELESGENIRVQGRKLKTNNTSEKCCYSKAVSETQTTNIQWRDGSEFEHLKQTGKPIAEYEAHIHKLAEYAPHLVATDEMRARRFKDGLRYEIKRGYAISICPTYVDSLDRSHYSGAG
ncbi:hypothetical protein Acr_28g0004530 [Actinidia rufa]|uniref:Retrotransposon gag domain-containing protein n=1 Tax=Actinidia rufa TaxID=165716 RepID=A0A7J0H9Q5_9ERIC|nr:hypothetical protein Acr_28g0004530 [Actinidia rufa]